jgi:hypothetical protein
MSGTPDTSTRSMNLPSRLREAATFALMDAARDTVVEAANEIERLLTVLDTYALYAAAAQRELASLRTRVSACRCGEADARQADTGPV